MSTSSARQQFRAALAAIAAKAKDKLPECNGRVEAAATLVLAGDVEILDDHTATVASQTDPGKTYAIEQGVCPCADFSRAPHGFCKHRLSVAMARRIQEQLAALPTPAPAAPGAEAPVSITLKGTLHGQDVMVTLRGVDFASVKAQVEEASMWLDAPSTPAADDTSQCPMHGVKMKLNHGKDGSTWLSHKTAEGWCKGVPRG